MCIYIYRYDNIELITFKKMYGEQQMVPRISTHKSKEKKNKIFFNNFFFLELTSF